MRRREFIALLSGTAVWPLLTHAEGAERRRLGFLSLGLANDGFGKNNTAAFLQGLDALGWKEAVNLQIDWRWYGADAALAERQAAELIALKPDVILAGGNPAVEKTRQQKAIPVVFTLISDPVGLGYVDSLAHPGGNLTGFESYTPAFYTKELQVFTEIMPPATSVAILYNPATAPYGSRMVRAMENAAKSIGVAVRDAPCHDAAGIEATIAALPRDGGLLALGDIFTQVNRETITSLALKYKVATVANTHQLAESGALITYALDIPELFRRSTTYIDRILKGEKPADLPVQAPIKFELIINLKTAKALGVTVPATLQAVANEVIE